MEYCDYPSLEEISLLLTEAQKKDAVSKLMEVVNYLHTQGVCHRDLKLENVLYNQQTGDLKLIDFGICKRIRNPNNDLKMKMCTNTGTLQYMAPEVLSGVDYDESVDCWSLGVLTYRLFYNKFPF